MNIHTLYRLRQKRIVWYVAGVLDTLLVATIIWWLLWS